MTNDPFDTLVKIELQCRQYGKPLPSQKAIERMWHGVGFISGGKHYVAPLNEIKEILLLPALTVLPSAVGWFRGIANLRGHLLPITDLQNFISEIESSGKIELRPTVINALSRIIVIDFESSLVGFLVQEVLGIQRFPEEMVNMELANQENKAFHDGKILWHPLSLNTLSCTSAFKHIVKQAIT